MSDATSHQTRVVVVSGGLGEPSSTRLLADRLAAAVRGALGDAPSEVSVLELRDIARDITDALLTRVPSPALQTALDAVAGADGLVVVSPIFSASYSGLFKSFFDVIDPEALEGTPVLIAATGGTERHSLALDHALRPLFSYLHAVVVPTGVFAATADWGSPAATTRLASRIGHAADALARLAVGGSHAPAQDPYTDPTPFEDLLFGHSS